MNITSLDQTVKNSKDIEKLKKIDFKMVSFTLAGKDYGVDILKVKEIRKAGNFTHVPNTPIYVRGVDNLRGDIIPIIDLRVMFNLPAERRDDGVLENIIILRLDELVIGVIVDTIEKVVGIASDAIQPPHPIFGDINVKYISGVVENENRLYIILDVDCIFGQKQEEPKKTSAAAQPALNVIEEQPEQMILEPSKDTSQKNLDLVFISETLATFSKFYVTDLNKDWVTTRTSAWKQDRQTRGLDFQIVNKDDSEEFLTPFNSSFTAKIWPESYIDSLGSLLNFEGNLISVWNPGCGKGYETYSLAMMVAKKYPDRNFKVWANDNDLLNISMAPSLILDENDIADSMKKHLVQTKNGAQFNTEFKSKIMFEFHDVNHMNPFTDIHMIVARDLLSYLNPVDQEKVLSDFYDKLRKGGYLVLGQNEAIHEPGDWALIDSEDFVIYQKV